MNTQTAIVRRLLPLALTCALLTSLTPAVQAQSGDTEPEFRGCDFLNVTVSGTKAKVVNVTCDTGSFVRTEPPSGEITRDQPAVIIVSQSGAKGPGCTITVSGGNNTAVLRAEQNLCALAAGAVNGSVISGNAKLVSAVKGGFPSMPGRISFSLGF